MTGVRSLVMLPNDVETVTINPISSANSLKYLL